MIKLFPSEDYFFHFGLKDIINDKIKNKNIIKDIYFLKLSEPTIRMIIESSWLERHSRHTIMICPSNRLLPLARYYSSEFENIFIFDQRKRGNLESQFSTEALTKKYKYFFYEYEKISRREFVSIKNMMLGLSASEEAKKYNVSVKTIYSLRTKAANKLGLRKLCDAFHWQSAHF
ncbi:hypothetical protein [Pantoea sp. 1.19]|uniref:hypothetical protein n=1 Tax=Pantoea sp. 1.19 TaxID=1925589 RepID=UPI000948B785|nr:hypothetical protein [Pantoea sp. 1.19]